MDIRTLQPALNTLLFAFLSACIATSFVWYFALQPAKIWVSGAWGAFAILLIAHLTQYPRAGLIIVIAAVLVGLGFVLPKPVAVWVLAYPNALLDYFGFSISAGKVFHVIVYGFLGAGYAWLMLGTVSCNSKIMLTLALLVAMVMSEVFQLFVPNRSSSLKDISYNATGIVIGLALVVGVVYISRVCNRGKQARLL